MKETELFITQAEFNEAALAGIVLSVCFSFKSASYNECNCVGTVELYHEKATFIYDIVQEWSDNSLTLRPTHDDMPQQQETSIIDCITVMTDYVRDVA